MAGATLTAGARAARPVRPARAGDRWATAGALAVAAVTLGAALEVNDGHLAPEAIPWLTAAVIATLVALLLPRLALVERHGEAVVRGLLGAGIAAQFGLLFSNLPTNAVPPGGTGIFAPWNAGLAVALVLAGAALVAPRPWSDWALPALLVAYAWCGWWILAHLPLPGIDVYVFQRDAAAALFHGQNPYTLTFPNMYGAHSGYYAPQVEVGDRLAFGFPYPPLSLFLVLPGALLGDYRYAQLAALVLAGWLMARAAPGRVGAGAAALLLFTPRGFFVLQQGWTEPFAVCLLAATVYCARRAPRWLPLALGLLFAVKQYLVFAAPLAVLLLPRPWSWRALWRLYWQSAVVALAASLPLVLWGLPAFVRSAVTLQFYQPFRLDALSYVAWFARDGGPRLTWLALPALVPATALALWRAARTPAGFAAAVACVFLVFLVTNKQAFANYYFFVLGALCCAIAATTVGRGAWAVGRGP
ncbi:MAG TPA: hypothetical protein VFL91_08720 [Thermomicrobiales bacterium]|nr:hypothetical protein [Thermomicrobiales bacterium]